MNMSQDFDQETNLARKELMELRRNRNLLSPILSIPADIIINILKLLIFSEDGFKFDEEPEDKNTEIDWQKGKPFHHWVAATQFCSGWRAVALAFPALWTRIDGRNVNWAEEFVRRSGDHLLTIDTRQKYKYVKSERLVSPSNVVQEYHLVDRLSNRKRLQALVASQAHRIRRLYACSWLALHRIPQMPQLEMMIISDFGWKPLDPKFKGQPDPYVIWGPKRQEVRFLPSLPKLRWLKLSECDLFTLIDPWPMSLPIELPSLTHLFLQLSEATVDPMKINRRCPKLQVLSISDSTIHRPTSTNVPSSPVVIPALRRLEYNYVPFTSLDAIQFPTTEMAVTKITKTLNTKTSGNTAMMLLEALDLLLTNPLTKPDSFDFSLKYGTDKLRMAFVGRRFDDRVCRIELKNGGAKIPSVEEFVSAFEGHLRTIYNISFSTITAIDIDNPHYMKPCWRNVSVQKLVLRGTNTLLRFLDFLAIEEYPDCMSALDNEKMSNLESPLCACKPCLAYRFSAFPGLECFGLKNVGFDDVDQYHMERLFDFIGRRPCGRDVLKISEIQLDKSCSGISNGHLEAMKVYVNGTQWVGL